MSSVMHPVGNKPPNVYWRRRVVAIVALVIIVLLAIWAIKAVAGAFGDDTAATTPTPQPSTPPASASASATADPSGSATTTSEAEACSQESVSVTATSESKVVTVGQATKVGMVLENTGEAACTLDAGSKNLELVISSGAERIWSSDDCQSVGASRPTTVDPGAKLASEVPWEVVRSDKSCGTDLATLKAGTYQLKARAGEWESAPLTLTVKS